jgi:hypothetical protein
MKAESSIIFIRLTVRDYRALWYCSTRNGLQIHKAEAIRHARRDVQNMNQNRLGEKRHQQRREHRVASGILALLPTHDSLFCTELLRKHTYCNGAQFHCREIERDPLLENYYIIKEHRGILLLWIIYVPSASPQQPERSRFSKYNTRSGDRFGLLSSH